MPPGNEVYDLLMGDTPDSKSAAQALSELLRFKKGAAMVGAQALDPAAQAQGLQAQAAGEQKDLFTGLEKRMQYGQERQAMQERMAHDKEESRLNRAIQTKQIEGQNMLAKTLAAQNPNRLINTPSGTYALNQHTGEYDLVSDKGTGANFQARADAKELDRATNDLKDFSKRIDPYLQSSRSGLGASGIINLRGHRGFRLLMATPDQDLDKVPPQMVNEAVQTVASMVNGGYAPTIQGIKDLAPNTMNMTTSQIHNWVTSGMPGANEKVFLKNLLGVIERENRHAKAVGADVFLRQVQAYPRVTKHYPDQVRGIAKTLGVHDYMDDNFTPKEGVLEALQTAGKMLPEEITVRMAKGNETFDIPRMNRKDIEAAKAEGFQEVK